MQLPQTYWQALMAKQWRPDDDDSDDWLKGDSCHESGYSNHADFDDESDDEHDEDSPTVECSKCGCDMYEDAEQCPLCGEWQAPQATGVWAKRPGWFILGGLIGIIAVVLNLLYLAFLGFNNLR